MVFTGVVLLIMGLFMEPMWMGVITVILGLIVLGVRGLIWLFS
jgi:hypothetical protein